MFTNLSIEPPTKFQSSQNARSAIMKICQLNNDIAEFKNLGKSENGRFIDAVILGKGSKKVSLVAGAHSDEPVGSETLRLFIFLILNNQEAFSALLSEFQFVIIPHINPDGEARNWQWINEWDDVKSYLKYAFRELPGRDIEFGYPEMRIENRLAAELWQEFAPFSLHFSLHGMGFSEGAMLLIEREWMAETIPLRKKFVNYATQLGLRLHDHDRAGEKGFDYIAPGFTTTPQGRAMQAYFHERNEPKMAEKFHLSSMEYIRSLGGNPLSLVTELPLFFVKNSLKTYSGKPEAYLKFQAQKKALQLKCINNEPINEEMAAFGLVPFDLQTAVLFQLKVIEWGIEQILE